MQRCGEDAFGAGEKWMERVTNLVVYDLEARLFWFEADCNQNSPEMTEWDDDPWLCNSCRF